MPDAAVHVPYPDALLAAARACVEDFLTDLRALVAIDSGSGSVAGVNAMADWTCDRLDRLGMTVERTSPSNRTAPGHAPSEVPFAAATGDLVVGRRRGSLAEDSGGRRLLLLAHLDTVYDDGTAATRPMRVEGGRVLGPGVSDDKGGLLAGLYALEVLARLGCDRYAEVVYAITPDEEVGSPFSTPHLEALAAGTDAAFCLECARENGDIVSQRKGIAQLEVHITGRAAHAGVEPEKGRSAAVEAAHKALAFASLHDATPGLTVNVGRIVAGTRGNVVAAEARLLVDVRAPSTADLDRALVLVEEIASTPTVAGTTTAVSVVGRHAPMERTPQIAALAAAAIDLGAELGMTFGEASTGGAADANTIARCGVPVLDGLGPVGGDDHSPAEWLDAESIAPRIALLAGLVARVGAGAVALDAG